MTNVSLLTEANAEAVRVCRARQLIQAGDRRALAWCEATPPWVLITRRSALRQRLGTRVLLIWRVGFDDGNGRYVEWQLVATTVDLTTDKHRNRGARTRILRDVEQKAREVAEAAGARRTAAVETALALVLTQLARARAIAAGHRASVERDDSDRFQAGLFDRRAERRRLLSAAASSALEQQAAERIQVLERSAAIGSPRAQLVLAVFPSPC